MLQVFFLNDKKSSKKKKEEERHCLKGGRGLISVADFARDEAVGQVVPDLPAQRRTFLLRRNLVRVGDINPTRFGLQDETRETTAEINPEAAAMFGELK